MDNNSEMTTKFSGIRNLTIKVPADIHELEDITMKFVRETLQDWLESSEETEPKSQSRCCECGNFANFVSKRVGFIRSQFGLLRYKRAYYVCPHCHQSTCPLDERLDPVESLARLRAKLAEGIQLPVAEIARDWGLGSLDITPSNHAKDLQWTVPVKRGLVTNYLHQ